MIHKKIISTVKDNIVPLAVGGAILATGGLAAPAIGAVGGSSAATWLLGGNLALGALSAYSADKASGRATAAQDRSTATIAQGQAERLAFDKKVYEDQNRAYEKDRARYDTEYNRWEKIFGPLQENVGEYYKSLTPDFIESAGLQTQEQEFQREKDRTAIMLAQRGLDTSGIMASVNAQQEIANAEKKAMIRRDAPIEANRLQAEGMNLTPRPGQSTTVPTGSNVSSTIGETTKLMSRVQQQEADRQRGYAGSMYQSAGSMLSSGLNSFIRNAPQRSPQVLTANVGSPNITPLPSRYNTNLEQPPL